RERRDMLLRQSDTVATNLLLRRFFRLSELAPRAAGFALALVAKRQGEQRTDAGVESIPLREGGTRRRLVAAGHAGLGGLKKHLRPLGVARRLRGRRSSGMRAGAAQQHEQTSRRRAHAAFPSSGACRARRQEATLSSQGLLR